MKMEVLSVQNQYPTHLALATDWKSQLTLSTPANGGPLKSPPSYKFLNTPFKPHHHINHPHHHHQRKQQNLKTSNNVKSSSNSSNKINCDTIITKTTTTKTIKNETNTSASKTIINNKSLQTEAVQDLSLRLLGELRAAKSQHLACTEVSLPCDLTPRIALEILSLTREETNGLRDCTIYIEFEDEPNNSRRIGTLAFNNNKHADNTGYEIYVTISQDHRGWTALLPQFMKNFSRTITVSPEFNITKHRPYSKSLC